MFSYVWLFCFVFYGLCKSSLKHVAAPLAWVTTQVPGNLWRLKLADDTRRIRISLGFDDIKPYKLVYDPVRDKFYFINRDLNQHTIGETSNLIYVKAGSANHVFLEPIAGRKCLSLCVCMCVCVCVCVCLCVSVFVC